MNKLMLIDAVHPEETRVALVQNGQIEDFDFEAASKRQLRGNIYLAKVTRVEPSLQAAFVEYGGNRHGFLAFSEIHPDYYQLPAEDREALLAEEAAAASDDDEDDDDHDNGSADADGSDDKSEDDEAAPRPRRRPQRRYKIQEVIRRRQVMLVQVVKEERGTKGAALTTYLSLAGRYGVLMPNTPRGGGISRKITSAADRNRLKDIVAELDVPNGMGLIVRTAGAKRTKSELKRDYDYLIKLWHKIRDKTMTSIAPCVIHEEGDLVHRAMRDLFEKDIEEVLVEGDTAYREAKDLAKLLMPSQAKKVKAYKEAVPLFVSEDVEGQLDNIFSPQVKLKSGGYLVINQTEALVAIDVNSGKSTKERNIEQTALRTNLEAAEEACRQMRLRDLAGLIVIDFIDMDEGKNVRAIEKKMKDCLKSDRARVQHGRISQFGLMEISRQRRRAGVLETNSEPCPTCHGAGRVRSVASAALQLLRALEARLAEGKYLEVRAEAPGEVAIYLLNSKREHFAELEAKAGVPITITSASELKPGDFTIHAERVPGSKGNTDLAERRRKRNEERRKAREAERAEDAAEAPDPMDVIDLEDTTEVNGSSDAVADTDDSGDEDGKPKRRRRGRRGGRRRRGGRSDERTGETTDARDDGEEGATDQPAQPPAGDPASLTEPAPEDGGALLDGISASPTEMLDGVETVSPRKRRSRRKPKVEATKAGNDDTSGASTAEPDTDAAEPVADEPKAAPKARRPKAETPKTDVTATEPAPETKAEPQPIAPAPSASPEPEPAAEEKSQPSVATRIPAARVISGSDRASEQKPKEPAPANGDTDDTTSDDRKKGWWQRRKSG